MFIPMNSLNRDGEEDKIQFLIRKYLYIDPMSLKQWEDTAKMWGDSCKLCGKPMIPNKYADEFEKKMLKLIRTLIEEAKAEEREKICNTKLEEPPEGVEGLSDKRQAFLAGQMNMLFRIKFPKQAISAISNKNK